MSDIPFRRVVTGHDDNGKAIVISDGPPPNEFTAPTRPGYWQRQVWVTGETPAPIDGDTDPTIGFTGLLPPENGSVIRVIEFPPDASFIDKVDEKAGDIVVQRGTNHAWSNRSDKRARMAFILIDGKK